MPNSVVLTGSNPGLTLYRGSQAVAFASLWSVDWSVWGSGLVLVTLTEDGWRTAGRDRHFARILVDRFNRFFPEAASLPVGAGVNHHDDDVVASISLTRGVTAGGGGVELRLSGVRERRAFYEPAFDLGDVRWSVRNVYAPCEAGELRIDGVAVDGEPATSEIGGRFTSSSFIATSEVWTDPTGARGQGSPPPVTAPRLLRALAPDSRGSAAAESSDAESPNEGKSVEGPSAGTHG